MEDRCMSDSKTGGNASQKISEKVKKLEGTPFVSFAKPYLNLIGSGKIFHLVYIVMAVVSLILPLAILFKAIDAGIFSMPGKWVVTFLLCWLVIAFAFWVGFQLWWDRKSKVNLVETAEFVATPIVSEIIQTFGEWLGTLFGIIGAGVGLIATIILGDEGAAIFRSVGGSGLIIFAGPVVGFFTIVIFRFLAEQFRIFAALANNTKAIAENLKK
jgi:hypothetical protein